MPDATSWPARWRAVCAADSDEARERYDAAWMRAYEAAFRATARARGWSEANIESGWLDGLPGEALRADPTRAPEAVAAEDVIVCEEAARDA